MLEITKHAEERFAQRIMDYTEKLDINAYITLHKDTIAQRINKMVEYGEIIFSGKIKDGTSINVILKDTWILLTDRRNEKVITLYKVDLIKDDEDFNKLFVHKIKTTLDEIKAKMDKHKEESGQCKEEMKQLIDDNIHTIKEYRALIKGMEEANASFLDTIEAFDMNMRCLEHEYQKSIETLVSCKIF